MLIWILILLLLLLMVLNHEVGRAAIRKETYYPGVKIHFWLTIAVYVLLVLGFCLHHLLHWI